MNLLPDGHPLRIESVRDQHLSFSFEHLRNGATRPQPMELAGPEEKVVSARSAPDAAILPMSSVHSRRINEAKTLYLDSNVEPDD
jgi:hypothetical protein